MTVSNDTKRQNADVAFDDICAMAAEGIEAALANRRLSERNCELELENQRLRFEVKREHDQGQDYLRSAQKMYEECNHLRDLLGGRVDRGKVDAGLLVRGLVEIIKWSDDGDDDNGGGDGEVLGDQVS